MEKATLVIKPEDNGKRIYFYLFEAGEKTSKAPFNFMYNDRSNPVTFNGMINFIKSKWKTDLIEIKIEI